MRSRFAQFFKVASLFETDGVPKVEGSGSNSQFMIIAFGETLLNDRYTITIHDSVGAYLSTGSGWTKKALFFHFFVVFCLDFC